MKKFTLLLLIFTVLKIFNQDLNAQSKRMVLVEEFTNSSCGPCADANPGFDILLNANKDKVVPVKYQTNWPGICPLNNQNPTEVSKRVTYYAVTGVPDAFMDGDIYRGHPINITQSDINSEAVKISPFQMDLSHYLSSDFDSIYISLTITCTQDISVTGPLKCHIAIMEDRISFPTAPGSNGEKVFMNVMRKMLPNDQGTTLSKTWNVGQKQTLSFGLKIPTYIYDLSQISVSSWIQDNATKNIKQAAHSEALQMAIDAGISDLKNLPLLSCTSNFIPSIKLKNFGKNTLTSVKINYQVDDKAVIQQLWTGNLASGASETITMPYINTTYGSHTYRVFTSNPNGETDQNKQNDEASTVFNIAYEPTTTPLIEDFEPATFPPSKWFVNNFDNDGASWVRKQNVGGFGISSSCAKMDFYSSVTGSTDELIMKPIDLTNIISIPKLTFSVAYARYNASYSDRLMVEVYANCNDSWITIWDKSGSELATAPDNTTGAFTPTASQWRTETVDLKSFAGLSSLIIKFKGISGYGNNCYVDDINITGATGINEDSKDLIALNVFPNPSAGNFNISFSSEGSNVTTINFYSTIGETIYSASDKFNPGSNNFSIDGSTWPKGIYYFTLSTEKTILSGKIMLTK